MKELIIISLALVCCTNSSFAQKTQQYLSYNFPTTIFFNSYKREFPLLTPLLSPSLSYRIQRGRYGVELFSTLGMVNYEDDLERFRGAKQKTPVVHAVSFLWYSLSGLTIHYTLLNKKWVRVSPNAGSGFVLYHADMTDLYSNSDEVSDIGYTNEEIRMGAVFGLNTLFPVYKGWYVNTNIRYFMFPGASYNKRNLLFEMGIGYVFNRDND